MLEYLLYYTFITKDKKKMCFPINFLKKITITQFIFASNYIQYLLRNFNSLFTLITMKAFLSTTTSFVKKRTIIKAINLINLCVLNNIQPQ